MSSDMDLLAPFGATGATTLFAPCRSVLCAACSLPATLAWSCPPGGGKSLCYQLPALVPGTNRGRDLALIALMQDQAAQLAQMGIPAAVLNSSFQRMNSNTSDAEGARGRISAALSFA